VICLDRIEPRLIVVHDIFLTIVDDCSSAVWLYLLTDKKEVFVNLQNFITMVGQQFNKPVTTAQNSHA